MHTEKQAKAILQLIFILLFISSSYAQISWTKYENNPVLPAGAPGAWDDASAGATSIIVQNDSFKMWYEGNLGFGYATSLDGITWMRYAGNPVMIPGEDGSWDDEGIFMPNVLFSENIYKMWYTGEDGQSNRIGYATSIDGITWTKYTSNPVVNLGTAGQWDDEEVIHGFVLFDQGIYKLWYNGHDGNLQRTGYATSSDGLDWAKSPSNPVMASDPDGSWDDSELGPMGVCYHQNKYHMWYTATDDTTYRIGYATSPDGIAWTKYAENPVIDHGTSDAWDGGAVAAPFVLYDENIFKMWYGGIDASFSSIQTGYATAADITSLNQRILQTIPLTYILHQNYPNPFNPTTTINYELPITNYAELNIYNLLGQKVATLVAQKQAGGAHQVEWDARELASGIYYYRLEAGDFVSTRKLVLLK